MKSKKILCMCLVSSLFLSSQVFAAKLNSKKVSVKPNMLISTGVKTSSIDTKDDPIVGAPTKKTWTFKANKAGTYKMIFSYVRPWEKGVPAVKTVKYTIKVSNGNKNNKIVNLKSGAINKLTKGQKFSVTLEENASTGYSWSYSVDTKTVQNISITETSHK